jgi:putative ABC transport system permease protein
VLGLAFATLAWGVYIAARVLRFPDITPDGSFPLGAAVAATLIIRGVDPLMAAFAAFVAGMVAGYVTGVLHTRLRVTELLAGILVMTALYSVNLHVMGRSNVSLLDRATVATRLHAVIPATTSWPSDVSFGVVFFVLMLVLGVAFTWFLRTDFGTAMRAAGDNPAMIIAQGVDRRGMVELALALANGLVAFSGALFAQYQGFADVTLGVGTLVAGMAAVILGETLKPRRWRLGATIAMVAVGAIVFRGLIAVALRVGLDPIDLKLATAAFVLATLALPNLGIGRRLRGLSR